MYLREYIKSLVETGACETVNLKETILQSDDISSLLYYFETVRKKGVLIKNIQGSKSELVTNIYSDILHVCRSVGIIPSSEDIKRMYYNPEGSPGGMGGFGCNYGFSLDANQRAGLILLKNKLLDSTKSFCDVNIVKDAPCTKNFIESKNADITEFCKPIRYCQGDGSGYINSGVIVTKSPKTGLTNYAIRRHQIRNGLELGAYISEKSDTYKHLRQAEKNGQKLEAAICIGVSPAVMLSACMYVPESIGETSVSGNLLGCPLDVVSCKTINLHVPACSEIVFEGYIDPNDLQDEGPMTEYSGFSVGISKRNVFHLTGIMHREHPIYNALRSGRSAEHELLQTITHWSRTLMIKKMLSDVFGDVIKEVTFAAGSGASHIIIQVKNLHKPKGNDILEFILSNYIVKIATVVDETVNPFNQEEVAWATFVFAGDSSDYIKLDSIPTTPIDPSSLYCEATGRNHVCKIGINAISLQDYIKPVPPGWEKFKEIENLKRLNII